MRREEFIEWVEKKTNFIKESDDSKYWRYEKDYIDFIDVAANKAIYGWVEEDGDRKYVFDFDSFVKGYELKSFHKNRILNIDLD